MKPVEIRVALLRKGITQSQIAREFGISRSAVSRIIHGKSKSKRVWKHLSGLINLKKAA